jgi:hypothetical protein
MGRFWELEVSGHLVLECGSCRERRVLLGREDDWYSEGRTTFACECGAEITLANRVREENPIWKLMRELSTS